MAIRNIVTEGDPILRKTCREVSEVTERTQMILDDMVDTMKEAQGVGLAAPQVGIMRRMFVAEPAPDEIYYMVNPKMISQEGEQPSEEGCLSVPGKIGTLTRPEKIKMAALDRDGVEHTYDFEGFRAIVMCHEYDHLDGILYIDKADELFEANENYEAE